jgi:ribosomal protein S18 acetylase RimI-like enzyme
VTIEPEVVAEGDEHIVVRRLEPGDLEAVIAVDARNVGRRRDEYFKAKLEQNLTETGIKVSLAGVTEGCFGGFLLARVYYGEFGTLEPVAVLDTIAVHPDFQGQGIGTALLRQLRMNLGALGVARVQTEVGWNNQELMKFFRREGFVPAPRYCLDLDLDLEAGHASR